MAPVTIGADRGVALQNQLASGVGGVQNGSFNRAVLLSNSFNSTSGELFIDNDGVSRLRFPPNTVFRMLGTMYTMQLVAATGVVAQAGASAVFDYTFTTNVSSVTTVTANVAPSGFTVVKQALTSPLGTEDVIIITRTGATGINRGLLTATIADQSMTSGLGSLRSAPSAALVQAGFS